MLSTLGKNFSRGNFEIFFETICLECQSIFMRKIRKMSSICHLSVLPRENQFLMNLLFVLYYVLRLILPMPGSQLSWIHRSSGLVDWLLWPCLQNSRKLPSFLVVMKMCKHNHTNLCTCMQQEHFFLFFTSSAAQNPKIKAASFVMLGFEVTKKQVIFERLCSYEDQGPVVQN